MGEILKQKKDTFGSSEFSNSHDFFDSSRDYLYSSRTKKPAGKKHALAKKISAWTISILFLAGLSYGIFFAYEFYTTSKKIDPGSSGAANIIGALKSFAAPDPLRLKNNNGRINILLLGIGGKENPAPNLTDTIMIASLDTKTDRVGLFSIPRDLYVKIPDTDISTKINTVYQYGLETNNNDPDKAAGVIEQEIKSITSLDMDYYVVLNFEGFRKIIDSVGGVDIINDRDILDKTYPGPNYSYETFQLSKGFHHLDGATALQYARERHDDPQGDFGRAKRQQQIMQAAKEKIFSAGTLLNPFAVNSLFNSLGDNIRTDIKPEELGDFYGIVKKLDTNNINNVVIDAWSKNSLLEVSHVQYGDLSAFVLVPRVGNYSEIQELAQNLFDLNAIKRRNQEVADENATIAIINESGGGAKILQKIKNLLQQNLNYKNVTVLDNPDKALQDTTTAYDLTDGQKPFSLNELVTKLPAAASYDIPQDLVSPPQKSGSTKPDIVLVIGKDLVSRYNMEEGTMEDLNKADDNPRQQSIYIKH